MEASTGIEPVYTDLQSAASPLRQLAIRGVFQAFRRLDGVAQVVLPYSLPHIPVPFLFQFQRRLA